jgi:DNA adenine methylase
LPAIVRRFRGVEIHGGDAVDLIRLHDRPGVVFYLDPTYLPAPRTARRVYRHEMTRADHERLLAAVVGLRSAAVLLSGYRSDLYDTALAGWWRIEWKMANHAGQGGTKGRRVECLWVRP